MSSVLPLIRLRKEGPQSYIKNQDWHFNLNKLQWRVQSYLFYLSCAPPDLKLATISDSVHQHYRRVFPVCRLEGPRLQNINDPWPGAHTLPHTGNIVLQNMNDLLGTYFAQTWEKSVHCTGHRVHRGRDEIGGVNQHSQLEFTLQLCTWR